LKTNGRVLTAERALRPDTSIFRSLSIRTTPRAIKTGMPSTPLCAAGRYLKGSLESGYTRKATCLRCVCPTHRSETSVT
jgi:hypothetical protein